MLLDAYENFDVSLSNTLVKYHCAFCMLVLVNIYNVKFRNLILMQSFVFSADNLYSPVSNAIRPLTSSIKDLTAKLQSASVISVISPIVESALPNDVSIHTDESLIMNAEEATESPKNTQIYCEDVPKTFEDIGKQEFNDTILFKKRKQRKKRSAKLVMSSSTTSLSSNSSDEREMNYTRPTLMNLSCVGILPDLRSPESIKYDIEYKEKILADVLSLDKIKIINSDGHDKPTSDHSDSDCDNTDISIRKTEKKPDRPNIKVPIVNKPKPGPVMNIVQGVPPGWYLFVHFVLF